MIFTLNSPRLAIIQISIHRKIDKQIVLYSYNGKLLSNEKEQVTSHTKL